MNKFRAFCALAIAMMAKDFFCVQICAQERAEQTMTLPELYEIADRENQRLKISEVALQAAEEGVKAAQSAMLPDMDLSVQGSYTGNAFMLSRSFSASGTTDFIVPGVGVVPVANGKQDTPHWGNSFTAQVSQVLYAGGAVRSGVKMAKLGREMAELDVQKNRQEVRFMVTGYYLDLCRLDNQAEVIRQNIALTRKELEQMKARRAEGTVLQNDITRYEFQLQSLEQFFMGLFVFNVLHMYLAGAAGYGIYTSIFSHFMNENMMSYCQQLTLTRLDIAHFDLGNYIGNDFLQSMMMVTIKQVYGYVIWFALALAAVFLLCDIPAVRTNIRKVPRWPVYAIEYLAKRS